MSPATRVGGARGSRAGAPEASGRVCGCPPPSRPRGRARSTPARRAGPPPRYRGLGGAAALTVRAPLRLPVALPQVTFHVRGSPRCCAQVAHGARARPSPGRSAAAAPQSRRRRPRPGPTSRRRRRRRGHAYRRPAASGAAEPELSPGSAPRRAAPCVGARGGAAHSFGRRGGGAWAGAELWRGGRGLVQPGGGGAWAAGATCCVGCCHYLTQRRT